MIDFVVGIKNLNSHIFDVELSVPNSNSWQEFMLPNWIAGSYKIRDFAANIINISCVNGEVRQIAKNRFLAQSSAVNIVLNYQVYAFDKSVRMAYLDENRAFFNGNSLFLLPLGYENSNFQLTIEKSPKWKIATSLEFNNGKYVAKNYTDFIDSPVEIADFSRVDFEVNKIPHSLVITGKYQSDEKRLIIDLTKICEHHHQLFDSFPVDKYLFLVLATKNDFGGLEHKNSTSLICSRNELNNLESTEVSTEYMNFLSLCSHEYFHTWWIKSLKPKNFINLDLEKENYTNQLWIFEGVTSYYDDLSLIRTKLITTNQYLTLFEKTLNRVFGAVGNFKQSLTSASFNAWTQLYQAHENTYNSCANYYTKGALVAFLLDIEILKRTKNKYSLADIVKKTYANFHKSGLGDDDFQHIIEEFTNSGFQEFFDNYINGTAYLPLKEAFDFVGVKISFTQEVGADCKFVKNKITQIVSESCFEKFGFCVGDEILTINNEATNNPQQDFAKLDDGKIAIVGIIRDGLLILKEITLKKSIIKNFKLELINDIDLDIKTNQNLWLNGK